MNFKQWCKKYLKEDSPFGDVARDIHDDIDFPKSKSKKNILKYFDEVRACDQVLDIFEEMFPLYKQEVSEK